MSHASEAELTAMKKTWSDINDIQALQEQGGRMTQLMWQERGEKNKLTKKCEELVKENENLHLVWHRAQDMLDLTFGNFKNVLETILELSTKSDGSPLNNEMAQVVAVIDNIKQKQETDLQECKQNYLRRVAAAKNRLKHNK